MSQRLPFRRTLAFRTVAGVVLLLAAVLTVTGLAITATAERTLDSQLDDSVRQAMARSAAFTGGDPALAEQPAAGPSPGASPMPTPGSTSTAQPEESGGDSAHWDRDPLETPGQPVGVVSVVVENGKVQRATCLSDEGSAEELSDADIELLTTAGIVNDVSAATPEEIEHAPLKDIELSRGDYRVGVAGPLSQAGAPAAPTQDTDSGTAESQRYVITGLPSQQVDHTRDVLLATILGGSAAALLVTALLGFWWIRRSLRPLAKVSESAADVAALPLESGEVPVRDHLVRGDLAQPGTEIGDVGYALNLLLTNIDDALQQRNASEAQLRQFVADASHELRTPLASVRGYADMLRLSEQLSPQGRASLDRLLAQAQRMGGLVEDLLLLARLDAGRAPECKQVDLGEIVAEAVMDASAAGADHRWDLDVPPEPVTVSGDSRQLAQVVANLLSNARKHTPAGTRVTVTLESAGPQAILHVDDDGPGVAAELQEHLFDRFARGDQARTHAPSGDETREGTGEDSTDSAVEGSTGLGLAIVRTVVQAHGGEATVISPRPGSRRGARFTVRLPLA
ncbi:sensor histidine kinase [Kocuria soli]|uniref:histidine kinase n=1 Tax=Kocuria soli TaxID=2485125 RepID=A0A3N3ZRZ8_9MICC|nr:HAMP domain-containing sensor histidine kinase [Kocuria soli]ROZ62356.1 sensor histidine kinase [Kocuria soli]